MTLQDTKLAGGKPADILEGERTTEDRHAGDHDEQRRALIK